MYLVVIAWTYVVVMMAVVEATSSQGTLLGALVTLVLYGVVPVTLVVYLMGTPARRKALRAREAAERSLPPSAAAPPESNAAPDAGGHAAADAVAPMRKEP